MRVQLLALILLAAAAGALAELPPQQVPGAAQTNAPRAAAGVPAAQAPGGATNPSANAPAANSPGNAQAPVLGAPGAAAARPQRAECTLGYVVLDPAHGGSDPGARGPNGLVEADVVMDFARAARVALEGQGFCALLTREGNVDKSFDERSEVANGLRNAIFISLHAASTGAFGTVRTYWYLYTESAPAPPDAQTQVFPNAGKAHVGLVQWNLAQQNYLDASQRLAEQIQVQLAQKFGGSPGAPLAVPVRQLRTIAAPAVAVEVSSVAVSDAAKLTALSQPLADAIARAVTAFHNNAPAPAAPGAPAKPATAAPASPAAPAAAGAH